MKNPRKMSDEELDDSINTFGDNCDEDSLWRDMRYSILVSEKNSRENAKNDCSMLKLTQVILFLTIVNLVIAIINLVIA